MTQDTHKPAQMPLPVLLPEPLVRPFAEGSDWVADGWNLFRRQGWMLVGVNFLFIIVYAVFSGLLGMVPVVGGVLGWMLYMLLLGGLLLGLHRVACGERIDAGVLFSAFSHPARTRLMLAGALLGVGLLLAGLLAALPFGLLDLWLSYGLGLGEPDLDALMAHHWLDWAGFGLVYLLLTLPLWVAFWFVPVLVVLHDMPPGAAYASSLRESLRNIPPLLLYNLLFLGAVLLSVFTLFLGMLLVLPVAMLAYYVSYRRIYTVA